MRRSYLATLICEFFIAGAMLVAYRFAANRWGSDGFAEYALLRRTISLLHLPMLLGVGIAIPRFIATTGEDSRPNREAYFRAGVAIGGISSCLLGLLLALGSPVTAAVFFGSRAYETLVWPVILAAVGLNVHVLAYSYFRGRQQVAWANTLQVLNVGVVPLLVFALPELDPAGLIETTGAAWALNAGLVVLFLLLRGWERGATGRGLHGRAGKLFRYGIARVPGDLAFVLLLSLPPILAAHFDGIQTAGFVAFGMTVLNLLVSAGAPIGLILLPYAAAQQSVGNLTGLRHHVWRLLALAGAVAIGGTVFGELSVGGLLPIALGFESAEQAQILRIVMLGAVPLAFFVILRHVLDALDERALNTQNLLISLVPLAAAALIGGTATSTLLGLVVALAVLGALSFRDSWRLLTKERW